jgi:broad specificity phosphatase PhoE
MGGRKRLWLIRHGQSTFNKKVDEYFEAHPEESGNAKSDAWWESPTHYDPCERDAPLTELGVLQADDLPHILGDSLRRPRTLTASLRR